MVAYDKFGRVIHHKNALNGETKYYYGDENDPFPENPDTAQGYNNVFLTGIRQIVGSQNIENKYKYEKHGNIKEHEDENGKTWKYDYDPFGRLKEVKGPDNQIKKEISYILTGANFGQNNPNYIETVHKRSSSESVITKTFFDGLGDEIQQLTRFGSLDIINTTIEYDLRRRQKKIFKPYEKSGSGGFDPNYQTNSNNFYNAIDTTGSRTQGYPYSETEYMPDALDRVKRQSHPGSVYRMGQGKEIKHEYWTSGGIHLRNRILDENNQVTDSYIDKFGNTVETRVDPSGLNIQTFMENDVMGNLTKVTDPRNMVTTYKYNTMQLLREKISPDAGTWEYLYDRAGNLRFLKDANHRATSQNNVNISGTPTGSGTVNGSFTLNLPGNVELKTVIALQDPYDEESNIILRIKAANGTLIRQISSDAFGPSTTVNIYLPKGSYNYEVVTNESQQGAAQFEYSIKCQKGYEFIYHKYDVHNRLIEVGEYESTSLNNFTQTNADSLSFPTSSKQASRDFSYDTTFTVSGMPAQQNVKGRLSRARTYRLGALAVTAYFSYDDDGRVKWVFYTGLGGNKRIEYTYDRQGNIIQKEYFSTNAAHKLTCDYEYDSAGRLFMVKTTHSGVSNKKEVEYTYFPTGQPKRVVLGDPKAQGVDFRYNTRDWLIHINNQNLTQTAPSQDDNDMFGLVIGYDQTGHIGAAQGAQAQYNGNISWLMYAMHGVNFTGPDGTTRLVGYSFAYDKANRVLKSDFGYFANGAWRQTDAYDEKDITYHKNGNITALKRYNQNGSLMHNYTYTYYSGTNRLRRVTGSGDRYVYDSNGNVRHDLDNNIGFIIYDIHNLPVSLYTTGGTLHRYYYDHNGNRVRKFVGTYTNYINGIDGRNIVVTNNTGSWATYNLYGLDLIGQIRREGTTWNRFYFLKDHLGSVKVIVNASGNVVAYDDYYPFGLVMPGRTQSSVSADGRYKFTGKERDSETKYDYFGARYYDARIGRWLQVDPMEEEFLGWSPYVYVLNNPLRNIDILGMMPSDQHNEEEDKKLKHKKSDDIQFIRSTDKMGDMGNNKSEKMDDETDSTVSKISLFSAGITVGISSGISFLEKSKDFYKEMQLNADINNLKVSFKSELSKIKNLQMIGRASIPLITIASTTYEAGAALSTGDAGQAVISSGIGVASLLSGPLGLYYLGVEQTIGWKNVPATWVQYELNRHDRGLPASSYRR